MKRVLFVIDTLQLGGAEQSLFESLSRFKKIAPVVCHLYPGETLKPRFLQAGITVHSLNIPGKYGFFNAYRKLCDIIDREQPDLIVAYLTRSELVARLAGHSKKIPVIGTFVSDLYSPQHNKGLSRKAKMAVEFFRIINAYTGRYCAGFLANSESIKKSNARALHVPEHKIKVINRGRNAELFPFRETASVSATPTRFLNIGRLFSVKGQEDLIRAFKIFSDRVPGVVLTIIGDGPLMPSLTKLAADLELAGKVEFLGARRDVPTIISNYDCLVSTSYSEGFSGSVVEAMFSGLPVLASNIPANVEIVQHLVTGYIFTSGSVEQVAQAMDWLVNHWPQAIVMAEAANQHARQYFEIHNIVAAMEDYFLQMMPSRS